jgi:hypothetical protein
MIAGGSARGKSKSEVVCPPSKAEPGFQEELFVALNSSNPVPPYSSWTTAATNIQDAVDAAAVPGALVWVGNFSTIAGQKRSCVAALDVNANTLTPWNLNADFLIRKCIISVTPALHYSINPVIHQSISLSLLERPSSLHTKAVTS